MKFNPLWTITLLVIAMLTPFVSQGQKKHFHPHGANAQMLHHDHRKCGTEILNNKLAEQNPAYAKELREFKQNIIPKLNILNENVYI